MRKFVIKLLLESFSHAGLLAFAQTVAAAMSGNAFYTTPNPTLIALGTLITAYSDAVTAWGTAGNRGSDVQKMALLDTRRALEDGLITLSSYCMTTTPFNASAFISAGWQVKSAAFPIGPLPGASNVRVMVGKTIPNGGVKIKWDRVVGAYSYIVLRSDDNGATFHVVAIITKASHLDTGLDCSKIYRYVVQAVGAAGVGADSDVCYAQPVMKVVS